MKKRFLLVAVALFLLVASGCVDLLAVPGIALSSDGTQIYFLGGDFNMSSLGSSGSSDSSSIMNLMSANMGDGTSKIIVAGDDQTLISAFATNPTNGDLAYMTTTKAGETSITIMGADGSSRQLVSKEGFGGMASGTMMEYSPDGSKLALTGLLLPPDIAPLMLENDSSDLTPEQIAKIKNVAWLINVGDGSVKTISNPDTERANTLTWSPSGNLIAYNAWVDSNDDGTISTSGGISIPGASAAAPTVGDASEIHIYDVGSGSTTTIPSQNISFAPEFFTDSTIGFISFDSSALMGGGNVVISTADVSGGQPNTFYQTSNLVTGMRVSPDGSQVAWAEVVSGGGAGASSGQMPPAQIFVSPTSSATPNQVAELTGAFLVDVPVWSPDNKALLISSTNIFSTIIGSMSGMMSGLSTDTTASSTPTVTPQQVTRIDLDSGKTKVVYEGGMLNSGLFASVISLAGIQGLDSMMGASGGN